MARPRITLAQLICLITLPIPGVLGFVAYLFAGFAMDMCGNQLIEDVPSPSGRYHAVIFERDCGATTGFSTQIALPPAGAVLPRNPDSFFVADTNHGDAPAGPGGGPAVRVRWLDDTHLEISRHPRARLFKALEQDGDIRVRYISGDTQTDLFVPRLSPEQGIHKFAGKPEN